MKRQIGAAFFSGAFGWWGFPWGLMVTPVQIIRNGLEMFGGPDPSRPSPLLRRHVGMQLAGQWVATQANSAAPHKTPPPLPSGR